MDAFSHFHFLRPWWLLLIVPPLLIVLLRILGSKATDQWAGHIAPHLLKHLVSKRVNSRWLCPEMLLFPFALVLAIAMAGPAYRLADTPEGPNNTTLLIVVDLSSSMAGQDIGPSRIGRLRLKLRDLLNLRRGGRTGLIAVAGSAHVVMPPTDDADALIPYVDVLDPKLMPQDGEAFLRVAPLITSLSKTEKGPLVVLVAADSIPPDGAQALATLAQQGISLIAWAVGTKQGVPGAGIPGLDRAGFEQLERASAEVIELSLGSGDVRSINRLLDRARTASANPNDAALWVDSGAPLVFFVAVGVLLWFRRGWVLGRLSVSLLALLLSGCASKGGDSAWFDLWFTPDQQGRRLFEQGNYKHAAQHFEDPMWKGISYYTAHDWKKAQQQFSRVDTVEGAFNLGNAYAQNRDIASAIAAYGKALELKPTFLAARKNRDYLKQVLAGLAQSTDFEELTKPPEQAADKTRAELRRDQQQGPEDLADKNTSKKKDSLSVAENNQWMKQVATNPTEFLRVKFALQEQGKGAP